MMNRCYTWWAEHFESMEGDSVDGGPSQGSVYFTHSPLVGQ